MQANGKNTTIHKKLVEYLTLFQALFQALYLYLFTQSWQHFTSERGTIIYPHSTEEEGEAQAVKWFVRF